MAGIVAGLDICPICGAVGLDLCCEEDGQTCLDHWGRPADLLRPVEQAGRPPRKLQLVEVAAA